MKNISSNYFIYNIREESGVGFRTEIAGAGSSHFTLTNLLFGYDAIINFVVSTTCQQRGNAPDTDFTGHPANLKAGYRTSGRIFGSTLNCLVKYEINDEIRRNEFYEFPFLKF
jgi:hypothetical protein